MPKRKTTKTKTLSQDSKGRYLRNIGWARNSETGKISQKKFYLGHDEDFARHAAARLEALWKCVESRFKRDPEHRTHLEILRHTLRQSANEPAGENVQIKLPDDYEMVDGIIYLRPEFARPFWSPISLLIAKAIREGLAVVKIPLEMRVNRDLRSPSDFLKELRVDFNIIHLEYADDALTAQANEDIEAEADRLKKRSQDLVAKPLSNQRLHQAIEDYKLFTLRDNVDKDGESTSWAKAKVRQIEFVRRNTVDLDLTQVGEKSVVQIIETLRGRPFALRTGKPCSKRHAANCLKEFKVFLKWLDKNKSYHWVWPAGYEYERGKIADDAAIEPDSEPEPLLKTNSVAELAELYYEGEPIQRLYLLLGLNCGFIQAEQTSLRLSEIYLDKLHPLSDLLDIPENQTGNWIARFRGKTNVFGTWSLWPETVAGIKWWLKERNRIKETICLGVKDNEAGFNRSTQGMFLITQTGKPVATKDQRTGRLPNSYNSLLNRVVAKNKDFKRLSIKYLRKTGSTQVRKVSNAELASIYLAHKKPPGHKDGEIEAYANRPFEQLFDALDLVHKRLQPLWDAVPEPFAQPRRLGGKNHISKAKIQKIRRLATSGKSVEKIAKEVSVHTSTVYRHLPEFMKKKQQNRNEN
jgi:hypothetical protein